MTTLITRDVVEILQAELREISEGLLALPVPGEPLALDGLTDIAQRLQRFAEVARALDLPGLQRATLHAQQNVGFWLGHEAVSTPAMRRLLVEWPLEASRYLERLGSEDAGRALADLLCHPDWSQPLNAGQAAELLELLGAAGIASTATTRSLPDDISDEGLSLRIPEDVSPALLAALLQEMPELTERLANLVDAWAAGGGVDSLHEAQRVAHTIKGAANTVGVRGIGQFTHLLEEVLAWYARDDFEVSAARKQRLQEAADCLVRMSDTLLGRAPPPTDAARILRNLIVRLHDDAHDEQMTTSGAPSSSARSDDTRDAVATATTEQRRPDGIAALAPALKVAPGLVDDLFRLASESTIVINRMQDQLQNLRSLARTIAQLSATVRTHVEHMTGPGNATTAGSAAPQSAGTPRSGAARRQVLDEALGDLNLIGGDIQEHVRQFEELLATHERLHEEQCERVKHCRMLPAAEIVPRLERATRQVAQATDKDVELQTVGSHTLIDSHVLNALVEPLMHAIRNAVDHGMESGGERLAVGKPVRGRLTLSFSHEGTDVIVRLQDDGRGLDPEAIHRIAVREGLVAADERLSHEQLVRFILRSGFSTREQASQTSGRGLGLAAIASQIAQLKGTLDIRSERGRGCCIEFRVPDSMLSVGGVLVSVQGRPIGVAGRGVHRIAAIDAETITAGSESPSVRIDGQTLGVRTLEELMYGTSVTPATRTSGQLSALIVRDADLACVVLVDRILASRSLFVRSPGVYLSGVRALLGTTILVDGSVVPVLDLVELVRQPGRWRANHGFRGGTASEADTRPLALVVDDSVSVRRELCAVLESVGYRTLSAADGIDAWEALQSATPGIVLIDADMPRMDGLALTARLRADRRFLKLPVVIMAADSDSVREHARRAGANMLLPKPCHRSLLLQILGRVGPGAPVDACA